MSRDAARRYVVAYDIANSRRRQRVSTKLASYGDRIQFSVFVVDGKPAKLVRLRAALLRLIDPDIDSVLICDLGLASADLNSRFDVIGYRRPINAEHVFVL